MTNISPYIWACESCGLSKGTQIAGAGSTWHVDKCDFCGKKSVGVTEARDWGMSKFSSPKRNILEEEKKKQQKRTDYLRHKKAYKERVKKWVKDNPLKRIKNQKTWRWRERLKIIQAYGGKCTCCGVTNPEFLTIDHIKENGNEKRRKGEPSGAALYKYLRLLGYPTDEYQLHCMNCNFAKDKFQKCPHQVKTNFSPERRIVEKMKKQFKYLPSNL